MSASFVVRRCSWRRDDAAHRRPTLRVSAVRRGHDVRTERDGDAPIFSGSAYALAQAMCGIVGLCAKAVRGQVSPWAVVAATSASGWCILLRWAEAGRERRLFRRGELCRPTGGRGTSQRELRRRWRLSRRWGKDLRTSPLEHS